MAETIFDEIHWFVDFMERSTIASAIVCRAIFALRHLPAKLERNENNRPYVVGQQHTSYNIPGTKNVFPFLFAAKV